MKTSDALARFVVAIAIVGGASACAEDSGSPPLADDDDAATDSDASSTAATIVATLESSGDELPPPICMPGEIECDGTIAIRVCADTGLEWESTPCMPNQTCVVCGAGDGTGCTVDRCMGPCESEDTLPSSAGCSFISNRTLHLVDALSSANDIPEKDWEVDGLVVANPVDDVVANVQLFQVPEGESNEVPLGEMFTLQPLESRQIDLDSSFVKGSFTRFRTGGMLRVESDSPIIAYQHAPWRAFVGNDSSMLLPETALGRTYVVASYPPHYVQFQGAGEPTYFEIIATEDDTEVRWHAQYAATSGDGLPVHEVEQGKWSAKYPMNRFDTLRVTASSNFYENDRHRRDVSGTVIEANRPIWVVGASRCSAVPISEDYLTGCDPLQEMMIPLELWGDTYVAAPPPPRGMDRHYWRIYGAEEGITVTTTPADILPDGAYVFSSRGNFIDISVDHGVAFTIEADGPVLPVGYLQTRDPANQIGDPAMYQLVSVDQFLGRYVFSTGVDFDSHWVQIVRATGGADVVIDAGTGNEINVVFDESIGDFEYAIVQVGEGTHRVESMGQCGEAAMNQGGCFGITQFGWANGPHDACIPFSAMGTCQSSYAYPGGMKSEQIYQPG